MKYEEVCFIKWSILRNRPRFKTWTVYGNGLEDF